MSNDLKPSDEWRFQYYFDKLYPMGIMSEYNEDRKGFAIIKMNEILLSNLKSTNSIISVDGLNPTRYISYRDFFADYLIREPAIRLEYEKIIKWIIEFYIWNYRNLQEVEARIETLSYFELEIDHGQRGNAVDLLIIKSKVPGGIETRLYNEKDEVLYVDIYGVPQIMGKKFVGLQNVIPVVNERRKIFQMYIEKIKKSESLDIEKERNRVIDHITKGLYFRLSTFLASPRPEARECVKIISKVIGYALEWKQARQEEITYLSRYKTIDVVEFLKAIYIHALIINKSHIEDLSIELIRKVGGIIMQHINKTIGRSISMSVVEEMLLAAECWDFFELPLYKENRFCQEIASMKLIAQGEVNLKLKFYCRDNDDMDMNYYYVLIQTFFELFVNHIKHNERKAFHVWQEQERLIFSNTYIEDVSRLSFGSVESITAGQSRYGLISLEKDFRSFEMEYRVNKTDMAFVQEITWNHKKIFEL